MPKNILVTKENGEMEPFEAGKLYSSLQRSGASDKQADQIVREIKREISHGFNTRNIYKRAFQILKKTSRGAAARYSKKRAILELGPSGFPFEDFVGEIFKAKGFVVQSGLQMHGACVEHEVDLVAFNDNKYIVGEIKFHNQLGMKSDLKVALYVQARVEDLQRARTQKGERKIDEGYLITNTKFSKAAIQYANCKGLKVLSWTYPRYGNLQDLIEETKVHPITCLTTLNRSEKIKLMENGVILCKTIPENKIALENIGISGNKLGSILREGEELCGLRI